MDWIFPHIIAKAPPAMTAKNVKYRRGSRMFMGFYVWVSVFVGS
jgi:hypothetical protein